MFPTLSFKKFQRRIRLPFTFFKKLTKKQKKNQSHKRQASKQNNTHIKSGAEDKSVHDTLAVPTLDVKIPSTPNTITSSDSGVFFPPTPKTSSPESGPTSRVHAFERALPEIVDEDELNPSAQAETNTFVEKGVVANKPVEAVIDQEEVKADPVDIKDAVSVKNTPPAIEVEVEPKQQAMLAAFYTESVSVADVIQNNGSTGENAAIEVESTPLLIQDEVAVEGQQKTLAPCPEPESVKELTVTEPAEQDQVTEVGMTPLASEDITAKEQPATPVDFVSATETSNKTMEPTVQVKEVEHKSEDIQLVESPVVENFTQELHIVTAKGGDAFKPVSIQNSPPQTPRSTSSQKFVTPRKRVTSEGQTQKDKEIMDELQASVRSREKKRKEQERIQAAEKERKQRELSAKMEMERQKADQFADGDEVLRDVRSWRKQREASLKRSPDDAAKIAAYREAFAREEIMLELQSAVQNRSARGPYVEDPAEKRQQLLLEELYASRVSATKA